MHKLVIYSRCAIIPDKLLSCFSLSPEIMQKVRLTFASCVRNEGRFNTQIGKVVYIYTYVYVYQDAQIDLL